MKEQHSAQERIFEIMNYLYQNHISGLSNKELAKMVGTSETNMCRDIAVFERYGYVARNGAGRWRLSPEFGNIAGEIIKSYKIARLRLTEDESKYTGAI